MFHHDRRRGTARGADQGLRRALAGAVLATMLALVLAGPGYALHQATNPRLDAAATPSAWSTLATQVWTGITDFWNSLWSPIGRLAGATTTEGSTTTDDGSGTGGSGGFGPGGGGGILDPDGAF